MISNPARNASPDGELVRDTTYIADSFSADLAPGSAPHPADDGTYTWPVEPGRYRLMAARACPGRTARSSSAASSPALPQRRL
ncbi:hypothetical protein COGO111599_04910 [Corynebacterium gottingense]